MANKKHRLAFVRLGSALLLVLAGLWAAGLTPLDAFGPPPDTARVTAAAAERAVRESGTPDHNSHNRDVRSRGVPDQSPGSDDLAGRSSRGRCRAGGGNVLSAKGVVAGATVEQAIGGDGVRVARVRIRLTQPAAHQVRSKRNVIYVDLDSAFPLGSVGAAAPMTPCLRPLTDASRPLLQSVRAAAKPTGASITLTGNGELVAESVTPFGDGTPRLVLDFPNVRSQTPADVFVGRGPVSVVHVTTAGVVPTTRVVVDLLRPATYRVIPPENGEKDFTILLRGQ